MRMRAIQMPVEVSRLIVCLKTSEILEATLRYVQRLYLSVCPPSSFITLYRLIINLLLHMLPLLHMLQLLAKQLYYLINSFSTTDITVVCLTYSNIILA